MILIRKLLILCNLHLVSLGFTYVKLSLCYQIFTSLLKNDFDINQLFSDTLSVRTMPQYENIIGNHAQDLKKML